MPIKESFLPITECKINELLSKYIWDDFKDGITDIFHNRWVEMRPDLIKEAKAIVGKYPNEKPLKRDDRSKFAYQIKVRVQDKWINISKEICETSADNKYNRAKGKAILKVLEKLESIRLYNELVSVRERTTEDSPSSRSNVD